MSTAGIKVELDFDAFQEEGLYLLFDDATRVELTRKTIAKLAEVYWKDPEKIPPEVKKAADFQLCAHCPEKGKDVLCCALKPMIPYVDKVGKYFSYDQVTAVYRQKKSPVLHVVHTSMQEALKYLSILSLTFYCKMGGKYHRYFDGVIPLMDIQSISDRVYLNIYLECAGNPQKIKEAITIFKKEIFESSKCMVKRLHLLCHHDAFVNAFINAELVTEFLDLVVAEAA